MDSEKTKLSSKKDKESGSSESCCSFHCCKWFPQRYFVGFMIFIARVLQTTGKYALSVSIMKMTDPEVNNSALYIEPEFEWSSADQELALSAYYWLHWVLPFPAAYLSRKFKGKVVLNVIMLVISLGNLLSPVVLRWNTVMFIILRAIQGLANGGLQSCCLHLLGRWTLRNENTIAGCFPTTGGTFGAFIILFTSGYIVHGNMDSVFYVSGGIGLIWCIGALLFLAETPEESPCISDKELQQFKEDQSELVNVSDVIPWKQILLSPPCWAIYVAHIFWVYSFLTISTDFPRFIHRIMGLSIMDSAILHSKPYLIITIMIFLISFLNDWIFKKCEKVSYVRLLTRKLVVGGSFGALSIFLIVTTFTFKSSGIASVMIYFLIILHEIAYIGYISNTLDIAPQYAGFIKANQDTIAYLIALLSPVVTAAIVTDINDSNQWNIVLYILSGFSLFGAIVYCVLGKADVQDWAKIKDNYQSLEDDKSDNN